MVSVKWRAFGDSWLSNNNYVVWDPEFRVLDISFTHSLGRFGEFWTILVLLVRVSKLFFLPSVCTELL